MTAWRVSVRSAHVVGFQEEAGNLSDTRLIESASPSGRSPAPPCTRRACGTDTSPPCASGRRAGRWRRTGRRCWRRCCRRRGARTSGGGCSLGWRRSEAALARVDELMGRVAAAAGTAGGDSTVGRGGPGRARAVPGEGPRGVRGRARGCSTRSPAAGRFRWRRCGSGARSGFGVERAWLRAPDSRWRDVGYRVRLVSRGCQA